MARGFRSTGFDSIPPAEALELLGRLLRTDVAQIGVIPADWPKVLSTLFDEVPPLFANLAGDRAVARDRLLPALERTPLPIRRRRLEDHLRGLIVSTMGRDPFPSPENDLSFFELGMDSLMSLALRNRLQSDLERTIPSTVALEHPTIPELADYLIRSVLPAEMFAEALTPSETSG